MIEKMKGQIGITTVSLVITIIILLILAGIVIGSISQTTPISDTAKSASSAYKEESVREKLNLKLTNLFIEKLGTATLSDIIELKEIDPEIAEAYQSGDKAIVVMDNYQFEINKNLSIESVEKYTAPSELQVKKVKRKVSVDTFDRTEE